MGIVFNAITIYFEIKGLHEIINETGKRIAVKIYKLYYYTIKEIVNENRGTVYCFSNNSFLIIYSSNKIEVEEVIKTAQKIAFALTQLINNQLEDLGTTTFGMSNDRGDITRTCNISNIGLQQIEWFGLPINKAIKICGESAKQFYIGISGQIFHKLDDSMKTVTRRNLIGIKKEIEMWSRVSYEFDNTKRHLYQTNITEPIEN